MRIFALTVGRNEEHRYLEQMIMNLHGTVDGHFFYDDQSTDNTAQIARDLGCAVIVRPDILSSFAEDEGAFRGAAWNRFEMACHPEPGDRVLVIDCDEFLVARRTVDLNSIIPMNTGSVDLQIPEVFGFDEDDTPLVRVDRLWGTIHAPRLFSYQYGGGFAAGRVGVPAVPSYVQGGPWSNTEEIAIMHFGYADERDRKVKYDRYKGVAGHSFHHVESILAEDIELRRCNEWKARVSWSSLRKDQND